MQVIKQHWNNQEGWKTLDGEGKDKAKAQLVLYFGERQALENQARYDELKTDFPNAHIVGCSSGGEILDKNVFDQSIVSIGLIFDSTTIKVTCASLKEANESLSVGTKLGEKIKGQSLKTVYVLSDGLNINGSELVKGIAQVVGKGIPINGGLAGDNDRFQKTLVGCNNAPVSNQVAAIGFYGNSLNVGHGSIGGWDPFGPERIITKSKGNVLYELDNKPALSLYKQYLGEHANELPSSALLFPLTIRYNSSDKSTLVRTILSVDEKEQTMTFAGNIPEGGVAQLMHGNFSHLVEGASEAAQNANFKEPQKGDRLAILVSCIGRKLLMGQNIGDEVEAISEVFGQGVDQVGFYSYGEISPMKNSSVCELHNQTMTVTTFEEH